MLTNKFVWYNDEKYMFIENSSPNKRAKVKVGVFLKYGEIETIHLIKNQDRPCNILVPAYIYIGDKMQRQTFMEDGKKRLNSFPHIFNKIPEFYTDYIEALAHKDYPEYFI